MKSRLFRPFEWPMLTKLLVTFFLIAVVPVAAIGYYSYNVAYHTVLEYQVQVTVGRAERAAEHLDLLLKERQTNIHQLVEHAPVKDFSITWPQSSPEVQAAAQGNLNNLVEANPNFQAVYLMNREGQVILSSTDNVGLNFSFRPYFQEALSGNAYISDISISVDLGKPVIYYSAPVKDHGGEVVAVAVLRVLAEEIWSLVEAEKDVLGIGSLAILFDEYGIRLAHSSDRSLIFKAVVPLDPQLEAQLLAERRLGDIEKIEATNLPELAEGLQNINNLPHFTYRMVTSDETYHAGAARLNSKPWTVIETMPESAFLRPVKNLGKTSANLIGGIFLAMIVVSVLAERWIIKPVRELTASAQRLSSGELDQPISPFRLQRGDEIGTLLNSFEGMRASLKESYAELEARNLQLRRLYELAITLTGDINEVTDRVVTIIAELLEVEVATVEEIRGDKVTILSMYDHGQITNDGELLLQGSPCEKVGEEKQFKWFNQAVRDFPQDAFLAERGLNSYLGGPILDSRGEVLGVINAMDKHPRDYTEADIHLLQTLAKRVGVEIERKQAEASLKASEERYRGLFEGVPIGLYRTTPEGRFLDANRALVEILRYPDRETLVAVNATDLYVEPEVWQRWVGLMAGEGIVQDFEVQLRCYDGTIIWAEESISAVRNPEGEPVYYEGSIEDITERVRAEQETERSYQTQKVLNSLLSISMEKIPITEQLERALDVLLSVPFMPIQPKGGIFLVANEPEELVLLTHRGLPPTLRNVCSQVTFGHCLCGRAAASRQIQFTDRVDDRHEVQYEGIVPHGHYSVPILSGEKMLGVIVLYLDEGHIRKEHEVEFLSAVANTLAGLIERKQAETTVQQSADLLSAISEAQSQYIADTPPRVFFDRLLSDLLPLTQSEYGFIGEVLYTTKGDPYLKIHAITNIAWNEEIQAFYEQYATTGLEFHNLKTLFGAVMTTGKAVIANDPSTDPRRGGLPEGHPPLNTFLGLPFYSGEKLVGMVGIANRPGGYHEELITYLQPFLATCATILEAHRTDQQRRQREREREAIITVASALRIAATRSDMLPVILDQTMLLLSANAAALAMRVPETEGTLVELAMGAWEPVTGLRLAAGEGVFGCVIASGAPIVTDNILEDPRLARPDLVAGQVAVVGMPLTTTGQTIGSLLVGRLKPFTQEEVSILRAIADMVANAIQRASLREQNVRRAEQLAIVNQLGLTLAETLDLPHIYLRSSQTVLQILPDIANVFISLYDPNEQLITCAYGIHDGEVLNVEELPPIPLEAPGVGTQSEAIHTWQPYIVNDLQSRLKKIKSKTVVGTPGPVTQSGLYVPMLAEGKVIGVVQVQSYTPNRFTHDDVEMLTLVANTTAIAIDNTRLFTDLQKANIDLFQAYDSTLEGWTQALDLRDKETEGHTQRVTDVTLRLARAMKVNEEELIHIRRGALLHDIGKMGIPDNILLKPGPLTDEEWEIMRQHPVYACNILSSIEYLRPALDIPCYHHEKWDGTGYPEGLKGDEIPLPARIFAIVDVWDALSSDRPYRKAWSAEHVRTHLIEQKGTHFDPQVVEAFLEIINSLSPGGVTR
ncbi:MAG: GAF domain-containing protein [Chloroflexota bacterium]